MKLLHAIGPDCLHCRRRKTLLRDLLDAIPVCRQPTPVKPEDGDDAQGRQRVFARGERGRENARKTNARFGPLDHPETFNARKPAWRLTLRRGDFEWLLQVLNDVRWAVGSRSDRGGPARQLPE
jgi:hypothetical protein